MSSGDPLRHALPSYPRVVVDDGAIVIIYEDDERTVWGYETDRAKAEQIAEEISMGLRSILYVRSRIVESLGKISDELLDLQVPVEMLEGAIDDAYCDVYRTLPRITKQLRTRAEKR